jgi:methionyl-tRNA formyltransferase
MAAADPSTVTAADGSVSKSTDGPSALRAIFFGSGQFAVPILDALVGLPGVRTEAVISAPDRPVGRKAEITPTPVTARARVLDLRVLQPERIRRPDAIAEIAALAPDLAILADYGQLIPKSLLELPRRGFLNLHPSALPRHRGASPIPATILAGDPVSAVTLMLLVEEMDAGPIVATEPLEVRADDTSISLEERAAGVAAVLLRRALPEWLAGRLQARPQPPDGVTYTRPLRREDGRLDPSFRAVQLERQVRAYQPWPGSYIETEGGRLIVWQAHVGPSRPGDLPGAFGPVSTPEESARNGLSVPISQAPAEPLYWTTIEGRLYLDVAQAAGGRRMSGNDYLRGHPSVVEAKASPA